MTVSDSDSRSEARWQAFIDALVADHELLTERIRESIRAGLPAYRTVSDKELDWGVWIDIHGTLTAARAG